MLTVSAPFEGMVSQMFVFLVNGEAEPSSCSLVIFDVLHAKTLNLLEITFKILCECN